MFVTGTTVFLFIVLSIISVWALGKKKAVFRKLLENVSTPLMVNVILSSPGSFPFL